MRRLLVPFSILIAALAVDQSWFGTLPVAWLSITTCRIVFTLVFLLAWRFRRGRIAFAVLTLALIAEALHRWGIVLGAPSSTLRATAVVLISTSLGLLLAALPWLNEWRVMTRAGILRLSLLILLTVGIAWPLTSTHPMALTLRQLALSPPQFLPSLPELPLPEISTLALAIALASLLARFLRRREPFEAGLLAAWGALLMATLRAWQISRATETVTLETANTAPLLFLLAAGVILGTSLLEGAFSLAFEDGLTRLPARRALEESLLQLGHTYTLAMVDIDHFKKLNDRHGHEVGDQVLRMVAELLRSVGGGGEAYRYGGEEFTLLFDGKNTADAEPYLETLRQDIARRHFEVRSPTRPKGKGNSGSQSRGRGGQGKTVRVTVSLGVAQKDARLSSPELVLKAADKALYRSKKNGRNRLTVGR